MNWKFIWNENVWSDSFLCNWCEDRFRVKIEHEDAWNGGKLAFGIIGF